MRIPSSPGLVPGVCLWAGVFLIYRDTTYFVLPPRHFLQIQCSICPPTVFLYREILPTTSFDQLSISLHSITQSAHASTSIILLYLDAQVICFPERIKEQHFENAKRKNSDSDGVHKTYRKLKITLVIIYLVGK